MKDGAHAHPPSFPARALPQSGSKGLISAARYRHGTPSEKQSKIETIARRLFSKLAAAGEVGHLLALGNGFCAPKLRFPSSSPPLRKQPHQPFPRRSAYPAIGDERGDEMRGRHIKRIIQRCATRCHNIDGSH